MEGRKVGREEAIKSSGESSGLSCKLKIMTGNEIIAPADLSRYKAPKDILGTGFHFLTPKEIT